jgi:hypothetical protein
VGRVGQVGRVGRVGSSNRVPLGFVRAEAPSRRRLTSAISSARAASALRSRVERLSRSCQSVRGSWSRFDAITETSKFASHLCGAPLRPVCRDRWSAFLASDTLVQELPDESTEPVAVDSITTSSTSCSTNHAARARSWLGRSSASRSGSANSPVSRSPLNGRSLRSRRCHSRNGGPDCDPFSRADVSAWARAASALPASSTPRSPGWSGSAGR